MNKVFIGMVLAVCILGMILGLLNERLTQKPEPAPVFTQNTTSGNEITARIDNDVRQAPVQTPDLDKVQAEETRMAREALAPPPAKEEIVESAPAPTMLEEAASVQLENEASAQNQPPQALPSSPAVTTPEPAQVIPQPAPVATQETKPASVAAPHAKEPQTAAPTAKAPQAATPPAKPNTIVKFVVFARDKGATVRLAGSSPMHYKNMTLENPHRVVIDLDGDWSFPGNLAVPKNELVNSVRVGKMDGKTRVVVDLKEKPRTSRVISSKTGDGLDLRVDK